MHFFTVYFGFYGGTCSVPNHRNMERDLLELKIQILDSLLNDEKHGDSANY